MNIGLPPICHIGHALLQAFHINSNSGSTVCFLSACVSELFIEREPKKHIGKLRGRNTKKFMKKLGKRTKILGIFISQRLGLMVWHGREQGSGIRISRTSSLQWIGYGKVRSIIQHSTAQNREVTEYHQIRMIPTETADHPFLHPLHTNYHISHSLPTSTTHHSPTYPCRATCPSQPSSRPNGA